MDLPANDGLQIMKHIRQMTSVSRWTSRSLNPAHIQDTWSGKSRCLLEKDFAQIISDFFWLSILLTAGGKAMIIRGVRISWDILERKVLLALFAVRRTDCLRKMPDSFPVRAVRSDITRMYFFSITSLPIAILWNPRFPLFLMNILKSYFFSFHLFSNNFPPDFHVPLDAVFRTQNIFANLFYRNTKQFSAFGLI